MLFLVKIGFPLFDDEAKAFFSSSSRFLSLSLLCFFLPHSLKRRSQTPQKKEYHRIGENSSQLSERESLRRDVRNDAEDKNDGRQTKCVYLLFKFFFFLGFLLLSLFQKRESIYLVLGDVFDSSRTSL